MNPKDRAVVNPMLALLGGAALGALVTALATTETGRTLWSRLRSMATGRRPQADDTMDDETVQSVFI